MKILDPKRHQKLLPVAPMPRVRPKARDLFTHLGRRARDLFNRNNWTRYQSNSLASPSNCTWGVSFRFKGSGTHFCHSLLELLRRQNSLTPKTRQLNNTRKNAYCSAFNSDFCLNAMFLFGSREPQKWIFQTEH